MKPKDYANKNYKDLRRRVNDLNLDYIIYLTKKKIYPQDRSDKQQ